MVYVINYDEQPLMPCSQAIARLLLKQGKAKCIRRTPFTIKLLYKLSVAMREAFEEIKHILPQTCSMSGGYSGKYGHWSYFVHDNDDVIVSAKNIESVIAIAKERVNKKNVLFRKFDKL